MSTITDIYDAVETLVINTLSTDYKQLPNPIELDQNNELYLSKGVAIAIGGGNNTDRYINCSRTYSRTYIVKLTRLISAVDHSINKLQVIDKAILDDMDAIIGAVENDTTLGGKCIKAFGVNDAGLNFLDGEQGKYLTSEISIDIEYSINL